MPDSGVPAALGFAEQSGLPFDIGLIRNHYVGRTFIEPQDAIRHFGVKVKLNAQRGVLEGKRVVVVDDSIVRGTTSRKIVTMLRAAGAREVHMRISSPPTIGPCFYGVDTPTRAELIASAHSVERDPRVHHRRQPRLPERGGALRVHRKSATRDGFCDACFTGRYPVPVAGRRAGRASWCSSRCEGAVGDCGLAIADADWRTVASGSVRQISSTGVSTGRPMHASRNHRSRSPRHPSATMKCPFCHDLENRVIDSRLTKDDGVIRRRRECAQCQRRFTTYERVEEMLPLVVKKDGRREVFDRAEDHRRPEEGLREAAGERRGDRAGGRPRRAPSSRSAARRKCRAR